MWAVWRTLAFALWHPCDAPCAAVMAHGTSHMLLLCGLTNSCIAPLLQWWLLQAGWAPQRPRGLDSQTDRPAPETYVQAGNLSRACPKHHKLPCSMWYIMHLLCKAMCISLLALHWFHLAAAVDVSWSIWLWLPAASVHRGGAAQSPS